MSVRLLDQYLQCDDIMTEIFGKDVIDDFQIINASKDIKHLAPKGLRGGIFRTGRTEREDLESLSTQNQKDLEECLFNAGIRTCSDNPVYRLLDDRTVVFAKCPNCELSAVFRKDLAEAGFYPLKEPGCYKCFHCGVSLRLQERDKPWIEHARWSPYCQYTIDVFGMDRVNKVVQDTRKAARTFAGGRSSLDAVMIQAVSEVTGLSKKDLISGATQFFIDSRGSFPNAERLVTYSQH